MSVKVKDNNIDGALRRLRNEVGPTLSAVREKKEYKKPGVRRREEKKKILLILEEIIKIETIEILEVN